MSKFVNLSESTKAHIALIFFSMFVAGTYSLGSMATPFIDSTTLMALRFILAALLMGFIVAIRHPQELRQASALWRYFLLGSIFAFYFVALFEALKTSSALATGAMFTLTPFITAGFAYFLLKQNTSRFVLISLCIATIGAIWVIFKGNIAELLAFNIGRGEKIFFAGVIAHALYIPLSRMLDRGEPVLVFTFGVLVGGSIPLLAFSFSEITTIDWSAIPIVVWLTLAYMVIFATLITFVLLTYSNKRLDGAKVMAYTYLIPSWVIVWDMILGRGTPTVTIYIGVSLTIVAMVMLLRR